MENRNIKNKILLLSGQGVSLLGSSMYTFGIGVYILTTKNSATGFARSLALVLLAKAIFSYIAEDISDKMDKKELIILMDLASGVVVLMLFIVSRLDTFRLSYIALTTFLLGTFNTIMSHTMKRSVPLMVEETEVESVMIWMERVSAFVMIIGPVVGGILFQKIGIEMLLLINGVSFIISGLSECFIRFNYNEQRSLHLAFDLPIRDEIRRGLSELKESYLLVEVLVTVIIFNMCVAIGVIVAVPYIMLCMNGYMAYEYGIISMAFPAGTLIGAGVIRHFRHKVSSRTKIKRLVRSCYLLMGILGILNYFVVGSSRSVEYILIVSALYMSVGVVYKMIELPIQRLIDKQIIVEKQKEVKIAIDTIRAWSAPIVIFGAGLMVDWYNPILLTIICSLVLMVLAIIFDRQVYKARNGEVKEVEKAMSY